jgi:hypothetical protein
MKEKRKRRKIRRGGGGRRVRRRGGGGGQRRRRGRRRRFFYVPQRLEAARKYIQQFSVEDDILMTFGELRNKLYTLKHQEKCKQITIFDWLKI